MTSPTLPSSMWSAGNPKLQAVWDSTTLQALQFCPRYYHYTHIDGWAGESVDLIFGGYAASAWEHYQKARIAGDTREEAQISTARMLLEATWRDGTPWGGLYETMWRCTGVDAEGTAVKYRNAKGNAAKCPYNHKGAFFPMPHPESCGECGAQIAEERLYVPEHKSKNRESLVRMLIWYIEEQPEVFEDGLHAYVFPDGTPAVELSFKLPLPWQSPYGDTYLIAGHLDYIGEFGTSLFITDNKTTTKALNMLWKGYSPHMQLDTYDLVGSLLFPDLPIEGVMIDAAQVTASGVNFGRMPYYKTEAQREEHLETIHFWIKQAEAYAAADYYPMNKRNCWLCPFAGVCSKSPELREGALAADFTKREPWDPTIART